ncbi:MAG: hypothetical protein P8X57_15435, partial [Cyclobacteriaceae bacterium]
MRKIISDLRDHLRNTIRPGWLITFSLLTVLAFWYNYTFDVEDGLIDRLPGLQRTMAMFLFHGIQFLAVAFLLTQ